MNTMMFDLPIYLNCQFFKTNSGRSSYVYKIEKSNLSAHPFQLFKLKKEVNDVWENLSVYASLEDAIMILLKELIDTDLADEVVHGQATISPAEIMDKINRGDRSISIYGSARNEMFRLDLDVNFEDLVERK